MADSRIELAGGAIATHDDRPTVPPPLPPDDPEAWYAPDVQEQY